MTKKSVLILVSLMIVAATVQAQRSFRGTYKLSVEQPKQIARSSAEETMWTFRVLTGDGTSIAEVRRAVPFDVAAPVPLVFENGRILLLHSFDAYAELYDRSGDLLVRTALVPTPRPDYERTVRSAVHDASAVVGISMGGDRIRLVSIDADGSLSELRIIEAMNVTGIAVSEDPNTLAVGTMSWRNGTPDYLTTIVSDQNAWTISRGFQRGMFMDAGSFLGYDERGMTVVSMTERRIEWSEDVLQGRMLLDVAAEGTSVLMLTAEKPKWFEGGWVYTAPRMRSLDETGRTIREKIIQRSGFSRGALERRQGKVVVLLDGSVLE